MTARKIGPFSLRVLLLLCRRNRFPFDGNLFFFNMTEVISLGISVTKMNTAVIVTLSPRFYNQDIQQTIRQAARGRRRSI